MKLNIDLDRGVTIRHHSTGMAVYMYKDTPGVFLTASGLPVSSQIAEECGYDTLRLLAAAEKKRRMVAAMAAIEQDFENTGEREEVVDVARGFKLVHTGLGRHNVLDPEGNLLNTRPLTADEGRAVLEAMIGEQAASGGLRLA